MTPEERELRRALAARSERPSAEFRARLSTAIGARRPAAKPTPTLAILAAVLIAVAMVAVLLFARQAARLAPPTGQASAPRSQATPTPPIKCTFCPIQLPSYAQLSAPSAHVIWVLVAGEYLARSTNRGDTWEQRPLPNAEMAQPEISFVNAEEGWLNTGGSPETQCNRQTVGIWHTTDGGLTWQSLGSKGIGYSQCKHGLSFIDPNRGFLAAEDPNHAPVIYRTVDGGRTWSASKPLPDPPGFKSATGGFTLQPGLVSAFGSTLLAPAFGQQSGVTVDYVFRSTDGGATWSYLASRPLDGGLAFVTESRWLQLIEPHQSLETVDQGRTWHPYPSDYSQAAPVAPQVAFADSLVGYATVRGGISRTLDGGLHWTAIDTPGTGMATTG